MICLPSALQNLRFLPSSKRPLSCSFYQRYRVVSIPPAPHPALNITSKVLASHTCYIFFLLKFRLLSLKILARAVVPSKKVSFGSCIPHSKFLYFHCSLLTNPRLAFNFEIDSLQYMLKEVYIDLTLHCLETSIEELALLFFFLAASLGKNFYTAHRSTSVVQVC